MFYYQILKQRRLALNLSIQQVSQQTRLKPEYVRALEEHDLKVFGKQGLPYVPALVKGYCEALGINWRVLAQEVQDDVQATQQSFHSKPALPSPQKKKPSSSSSRSTKKNKNRSKQKLSKKRKNKASKTSSTKRKLYVTPSKKKKTKSKKPTIYSKNLAVTKKKSKVTWGSQNRLSKFILISASCMILCLSTFNYFAQNAAQNSLAERKVAREKELLQEEATTQRLADEFKQRKYGLSSLEIPSLDTTSESSPILTISNTDQLGTYTLSGFTQNKIEIELLPETDQDIQILWNNHPAFAQKVSGSQIYELNTSQDGTLTIAFSKGSDKNRLRVDNLEISSEYLPIDEKGQTKVQFLIEFGQNQDSQEKKG